MTISSEIRTAGPFIGNGVASSWSFTFKVFAATEVTVVQTTDAGVDSTLNYGTDYSVTLNADQNASPGGTIFYKVASVTTPLPVDYVLNATSDVADLQPVKLTNKGGFFPSVINDALDRLTILVQQVLRALNSSLKYPLSDGTSLSSELPNKATRLGKVLAFDPTTGEPVMSTLTLAQIESGPALASQWASKTDGIVDSTDYSAKAYAIGGTGVTNTAGRGAAKEWATKTGGTVDGTEYSSKHYSQSASSSASTATTQASLAASWAELVNAFVTGSSQSAKEWAVGTYQRGAAGFGSAKDWATYTGGTVDDTEYSAKYYAALAATFDPANYVAVAGDTMTGLLTLSGDPTNALHAATKQYADTTQHGQCRFIYVSTTSCRLDPFNGNNIIINGEYEQVPAVGVTVSNGGLSAATLYYVYAYMNSGTMTLEISATGHTTHTNGVEIKTGDATRTLVGMVRTNSSSQFQDASQARWVASWFNRRLRFAEGTLGSNTALATATSTEVNVNMRANFLCWAGGVVLSTSGFMSVASAGGGAGYTRGYIDTSINPTYTAFNSFHSGGAQDVSASGGADSVAEGSHYGTIQGQSDGAVSATWFAGFRVTVGMLI